MSGNYPAGVTDSDSHFDVPSGRKGGHREVKPPATTMVYCPECCLHWEAPARADYWNARVETCPDCNKHCGEGEL